MTPHPQIFCNHQNEKAIGQKISGLIDDPHCINTIREDCILENNFKRLLIINFKSRPSTAPRWPDPPGRNPAPAQSQVCFYAGGIDKRDPPSPGILSPGSTHAAHGF
jgi:hypothetical protein